MFAAPLSTIGKNKLSTDIEIRTLLMSRNKMINSEKHLSRLRTGQPWSTEEDEQLLILVRNQNEWNVVANTLKRSFSSVQARFRFLKKSDANAASIAVRHFTKAERPGSEPDLTCGALSNAGRKVVETLVQEVKQQLVLHKLPGPKKLLPELQAIIGSITREVALHRLNSDWGWRRFTITSLSYSKHGISRDSFRNVLIALEMGGYLERHVGYPGFLKLMIPAAKTGRFFMVRASSRLIDLYESHGINAANIFTHFPSLR